MKYRIVLRGDNPDMQMDFGDSRFPMSVLNSGRSDGWLLDGNGSGVLMSQVVAFEPIDDEPAEPDADETPAEEPSYISEEPSRDGLFGLVDGDGDFWVHILNAAGEPRYALLDDLPGDIDSRTFAKISSLYGVAKVVTR